MNIYDGGVPLEFCHVNNLHQPLNNSLHINVAPDEKSWYANQFES